MKRISTSYICSVLVLAGSFVAHANAETKSFTLNSVEAQSSAETVDMSSPDGGEPLHVDRQPVLSQTDFLKATVTARKGRTVLHAPLNVSGTGKLRGFSGGHVGKKLAILVDGRLIAAPEIRVPIQGHG